MSTRDCNHVFYYSNLMKNNWNDLSVMNTIAGISREKTKSQIRAYQLLGAYGIFIMTRHNIELVSNTTWYERTNWVTRNNVVCKAAFLNSARSQEKYTKRWCKCPMRVMSHLFKCGQIGWIIGPYIADYLQHWLALQHSAVPHSPGSHLHSPAGHAQFPPHVGSTTTNSAV